MKAILIARVSTEEQRDAGNSLPAQVTRLENYCRNRGFEVIQTCSFDESAYTNDRTEFDRIIDLIVNQKDKIAVCADKVDRLSRNVFDKRISILYERALNDEIELHFVSEGQVITSRISAVEKFQFSISLGLAKYYSDAISDNVKRAMEQKLRKGEWPAKAPYGYKNVKIGPKQTDIVIEEFEAGIIKKVFELYATAAYSMNLLCEKLKKDYGIDWPKGSLGKVLNNPFYHGVMIVNNKEYPHRYPPIITKALFDQVQKVKEEFDNKPIKYKGKPYMYRGLLRCAECGLAITPERHKGLVYYHCTQFKGKHGAKWLREEEITKQLGKVFKNMQMPLEIVDEILETLNTLHTEKIDFHNKNFDQLTKQQKSVTGMLDNLYLDKLKGRITESEYDRFYQSLRDQLTDITTRLDNLQTAEDNYYMASKHVLNVVKHAYEYFVSSEVEGKRQLVKLVLSNVRVDAGKVLYDVQEPFNLIVNCSEGQLWRG